MHRECITVLHICWTTVIRMACTGHSLCDTFDLTRLIFIVRLLTTRNLLRLMFRAGMCLRIEFQNAKRCECENFSKTFCEATRMRKNLKIILRSDAKFCEFSQNANFRKMRIFGMRIFAKCELSQNANFRMQIFAKCEFSQNANFLMRIFAKCELSQNANFRMRIFAKCELSQNANFYKCLFAKCVIL